MHIFILVLNFFVCFNMLVMTGLLWFRKDNTRSNVLLGMFLLYSVSTFLNNILIYTDTIYYVYPLTYINVGFQLLTGPTLLLYFITLMGRKLNVRWSHLLHFIPALTLFVFGISQAFIPYEQKLMDVKAMQAGNSDLINVLNQVIFFHALIYFTVSWFVLKKYRREANMFFTYNNQGLLTWSKRFLLMLISINITCIVGYGAQAIFFPTYGVYADMILLPVVCFPFYLSIMIQAFYNHTIFTKAEYKVYQQKLEPLNVFLEEQQQEKKSEHTAFPEELMDNITARIHRLFDEEELYTNKELSLQKLAEALAISAHQLSYFINRSRLQNFSDFVNSYRIEKAKVLLTDAAYNNYSVEGIGLECGFNTRTTFYTAFRKHTGNTPVGYRKESLARLKQPVDGMTNNGSF